MIGSVKSEINAFSAKETAQKARFEDIENDVSRLQTRWAMIGSCFWMVCVATMHK